MKNKPKKLKQWVKCDYCGERATYYQSFEIQSMTPNSNKESMGDRVACELHKDIWEN